MQKQKLNSELRSGDSERQFNSFLQEQLKNSISDVSIASRQCQSMYGSLDSIEFSKDSIEGISTMTPNQSCAQNFRDQYSFISEDKQFNFSQKSFEDDSVIIRKIEKKQIQFKSNKLAPAFAKIIIQSLNKFTQNPSDTSFQNLLQNIGQFQQTHPFKNDANENISKKQLSFQLSTIFQELFYRNKNSYLVFTFDFLICQLSFLSCLLFYWVKINRVIGQQNQISQIKSKLLKSHMFNILRSYIQDRIQQINHCEVIFMIVFYFLNSLKNEKIFQFNDVISTQKKLVNNIKLFRKVRKKQLEFSNSQTKIIFQSQMKKYQYQHKLTNSLEQTYLILTLINLSNFSQTPLSKFYQVNGFQKSREQYQRKKDTFCIWIIQIILKTFEKNNNQSLYKAANYIIVFMSILKKFKESKNFEGISYLVPVIQNVRILLPKVWKYAVSRRNQIQNRLIQYNKILVQKQFQKEQFQYFSSPIIWQETIFDIVDKFKNNYNPSDEKSLKYHQEFYKQVIKKISLYQKKAQQQYQKQIQLYHRQKEIGISFNMYLLDSYINKLFKSKNIAQEWKQINKNAKLINQNIAVSFYSEFIDNYFIGSQVRYKKVDL